MGGPIKPRRSRTRSSWTSRLGVALWESVQRREAVSFSSSATVCVDVSVPALVHPCRSPRMWQLRCASQSACRAAGGVETPALVAAISGCSLISSFTYSASAASSRPAIAARTCRPNAISPTRITTRTERARRLTNARLIAGTGDCPATPATAALINALQSHVIRSNKVYAVSWWVGGGW
jgi:hypothetical protein